MIIFVCSALLAWEFYLVLFENLDFEEAAERLGASSIYSMQGGQIDGKGIVLGPIKLWDGQWWRLIVSGMLHGSGGLGMAVVHLTLNCLAMWYVGRLLEFRIGGLRLAVLFFISLVISILSESLIGHAAVGMSGAICAVFGYLLVLRRHDSYIREMLPEQSVRFMLVSLVVFIPLTYLEIMPVANVAHFSGLAYGYLAGMVAYDFPQMRAFARSLFWAAHLLIPVGIYAAMHPVWNAGYHWHLASERNLPRKERIAHLRQAVSINPGLGPVWIDLSNEYRNVGNRQEAWTAILLGVRNNPSNAATIRQAKFMGHTFHTPGSWKAAREILDEVFDDQSEVWAEKLMAQGPVKGGIRIQMLPEEPQPEYRGDQPLVLPEPLKPENSPGGKPLPPPDPNEENSAAAGVAT